MLLNCRLSFFPAHTLPESPLWLNRFIHCTNVQQLPLAVRNNCNCLSFAPLSLGFNLAPRSSLHNVFVLEDAASCSQQGVLFFFSLSIFSPSSSFCRGWSLRARLWTTDTQRRWDDLCRFFTSISAEISLTGRVWWEEKGERVRSNIPPPHPPPSPLLRSGSPLVDHGCSSPRLRPSPKDAVKDAVCCFLLMSCLEWELKFLFELNSLEESRELVYCLLMRGRPILQPVNKVNK